MTQSTSGMSTPRAMTSVHTKTPLKQQVINKLKCQFGQFKGRISQKFIRDFYIHVYRKRQKASGQVLGTKRHE